MKYVIINKTYSEVDITDPDYGDIYAQFPSNYPLEVLTKEYATLLDAQNDNIGKDVMSISDYNILKETFESDNQSLLDQIETKTKEIDSNL